jgi:LDH2 family malate/lactate/ureidoglycolate dehydrogenase
MPLAPGHSEILVPGELEWRTKQMRQRDGIPLPEVTWNRIRDVGQTVGIEL